MEHVYPKIKERVSCILETLQTYNEIKNKKIIKKNISFKQKIINFQSYFLPINTKINDFNQKSTKIYKIFL